MTENEAQPLSPDRLEALRTMPYELYLQTPEWQERRERALERAEGKCQICNTSEGLDAHHRTYERRGNERPADITVLCRSCHALFHAMQRLKDQPQSFSSVGDLVNELLNESEANQPPPGKAFLPGVPTGYEDLNRCLGGMQSGSLLVLAGRPQMRADLFALNIALNAAKQHFSTIFFSLTQTEEQITQQLLSIATGLYRQYIQYRTLQEEDVEKVVLAADLLNEIPLWVCDDVGISPLDIRARLFHFLEEKREKGVDLVVIEGTALLEAESSSNRGSTYQQFASTLRSLKLLAREFSIPLLVTYSLSKLNDTGKRAKAQLTDIQPAGLVEQFADVIGLLNVTWPNHEWYGNNAINVDLSEPIKNIVDIDIAFNRHGPLGTISVYYNEGCGLFRDLEVTPETPDA
jgi:replicative DNA helicase